MSRARPLAGALALLLMASSARASDPDPWFGADKALHFTAGAGLAVVGYGVAMPFSESRALRLGAGATLSLLAGLAKEGWDLAGHGTPSWRDLAWDAIGCVVGLAVALAVDTWLIETMVHPPLPAH